LLTDEELAEIASRPLDENQVLDGPRYEIAYTDDLGGLNSDTYIKLGELFDASTKPIANTFTVRFTAYSTSDAGLADTDPGVADGPWTLDGNPPLALENYVEEPAPEEPAPEEPVPEEPAPSATDDDDGLFGLSLGWTTGLLGLALLLRRKRF
jgi:hypothetical protein